MVMYAAHCGDLAGTAGDTCAPGGAAPGGLLVVQTNSGGQTAGPFFEVFPLPPAGWVTPYAVNNPGPGAAATFQNVADPTNGDNGDVNVVAP